MKTNAARGREIEALRGLLETYGSDRTRWPARERLRFANLIAQDAQARAMMTEAAALDRLLDMAPQVSSERESALAARIIAAAMVTERSATSAGIAANQASSRGNVLDLNAARQRSAGGFYRRPVRKAGWQAAGLMAASLVIGVMAGASGLLNPFASSGNVIESEIDAGQLALGEDMAGEGDWL
jgi:hypothetical protein